MNHRCFRPQRHTMFTKYAESALQIMMKIHVFSLQWMILLWKQLKELVVLIQIYQLIQLISALISYNFQIKISYVFWEHCSLRQHFFYFHFTNIFDQLNITDFSLHYLHPIFIHLNPVRFCLSNAKLPSVLKSLQLTFASF